MSGYNFNEINPLLYQEVIKSKIIKPKFKLSILNIDETIREDITKDLLVDSGTLSINYQQGQRRSLSFSLNNRSGKYTPSENSGYIWINTKFKLELGIEMFNGDIYYNSAGIFVIANPNAMRMSADNNISIQCNDKFALIDGTLGGVIEATYEIPQGRNLRKAIQDILLENSGNGYPIDSKPIIFDSSFKNLETYYTITKSPNDSLGSMLIEIANMVGADIWYGVEGNLIVRSGVKEIHNMQKPNLWYYNDNELEYCSSQIMYDFPSVKNRITVVGGNVNGGTLFSALAENTNPQSPTRIAKIGKKNLYIEDSNIYSNSLAQQRADYELNKISIMQLSMEIVSSYMIHLDVNSCISITDSFLNYYNQRFIIQSITIPISTSGTMNISCTNINSLPFLC